MSNSRQVLAYTTTIQMQLKLYAANKIATPTTAPLQNDVFGGNNADPYIVSKALLMIGLIGCGVAFIGNYSDKASRKDKAMKEFSVWAEQEHAYRQAAFPPVDATAQLIHAKLKQAHAKTE